MYQTGRNRKMGAILDAAIARRFGAVLLTMILAAAAGGCALTSGDFAQPKSAPLVLSSTDATTGAPVEVKPAVLVDSGPAPQTAAAAEAPPLPRPGSTTAGGAQPTTESSTKLLTPDEKDRVIAELEALARGQQAAVPRSATTACASNAASPQQTASGDCAPSPPPPILRP